MESIKHKMDTMVKEKDAAIERAIGFEAETEELNKAAQKFEKEVDSIQREIAKLGFKWVTRYCYSERILQNGEILIIKHFIHNELHNGSRSEGFFQKDFLGFQFSDLKTGWKSTSRGLSPEKLSGVRNQIVKIFFNWSIVHPYWPVLNE